MQVIVRIPINIIKFVPGEAVRSGPIGVALADPEPAITVVFASAIITPVTTPPPPRNLLQRLAVPLPSVKLLVGLDPFLRRAFGGAAPDLLGRIVEILVDTNIVDLVLRPAVVGGVRLKHFAESRREPALVVKVRRVAVVKGGGALFADPKRGTLC